MAVELCGATTTWPLGAGSQGVVVSCALYKGHARLIHAARVVWPAQPVADKEVP
jgi:hypothetical protein